MLLAILTTIITLISGGLIFRFVISPMLAAKIAYSQAFICDKRYPEDVDGSKFEGAYAESRKADVEDMQSVPFEAVSVTSRDGLALAARFYPAASADAPVVICFHGYRGTSVDDFCGPFGYLRHRGMALLMPDQRHQGHSEGKCMTFGIRERFDVLCWIDWVKEHCGNNVPIYLYGMSMGAATVLMASELIDGGNVAGIIADSPYTSADLVLFNTMKHHDVPIPRVSYRIVSLGACMCGQFRPGAVRVTDAVKNAKAPILLMHGEKDSCIPCKMSREIREADPDNIMLYTFPEAEHILSCYYEPIRYRKILSAFFDETAESCRK